MRCNWCYGKQQLSNKAGTMTLDTLDGILVAVTTTPISRFILIGGEPSIHKDLTHIIRRLKPANVSMVSNGVRLSDKSYLTSLKKCGLDMVTLSLKGSTQDQYIENTGVACLDRVEKAVANMNELEVQYNISVTFSISLIKALPAVLQWMKSTKAVSMSVNYCRPYIVDGQVSVNEVPTPKEMAEKTVSSYNIIRESGIPCTYSFLLPLCLLPREFIDLLVSRNELSTVCQLQKGTGLIFEPDGSMIPCHHLFDYKLGKLGVDFTTASEFEKFMKGDDIQDFYRKTRSLPDERCQTCSLKNRCGGGCLIQHLQYSPSAVTATPTEATYPHFYSMKFIYDKKIDEECHKRLEAFDNIFGEKKRLETYPVTPEIIQKFVDAWTPEVDKSFKKGIFEIFKVQFPDEFICYINSTPYSMDTRDGISVSASSVKIIIRLICHEANHYMFRRSDYKDKYFPDKDVEDAKEIFTIVNNLYFKDIMESEDKGWRKFWKDRYSFLAVWIKEYNE